MKTPLKGKKTKSRWLQTAEQRRLNSPLSPDVILDFVFDDGLLFIEIKNIGATPALEVTTKFNNRFTGTGGESDVSRLSMFRGVSFLAPGRRIRTFLDNTASYFQRKQPVEIAAALQWRDREGNRFSCIINHDLSIYRDIIVASPACSTPQIREE